MIKIRDNKLTINGQWYLNLDSIVKPETCPAISEMIIQSYEYLRHTCSIRTFDLNGSQIKDTWYCSNNGSKMDTNAAIFAAEIRNHARSPYWILPLKQGGYNSYIYDSNTTPLSVWENITWRPELVDIWQPFIDWVEKLPLSHIGHVSFFLNKPSVVPYYHVDSGQDATLEKWNPRPHREEFIWINFNKDKTFYIIDNNAAPVKIESSSAFFNTNNFHGSHDAAHSWTYSVRIEGVFSEELRDVLGITHLQNYYYE